MESQQNAYTNIRQWRMPVKKLFAECHSRIKSGLFLRDLWFKSGHLKKELSASLKTIWYQKLLGFVKHAESEIQFNGFTDLHYRACKQEQLSDTLSLIHSRCCYSCSCLQAIKYCFIVQSTFKKFLTEIVCGGYSIYWHRGRPYRIFHWPEMAFILYFLCIKRIYITW